MSYEEKPADNSKDVYFGIEWAESNVDGGTFTITPKIYRWDRYNTNNSGSRWSEDLTEPSGSAGSWSNLSFGSGSGYRVIDTFSKRTYSKSHKAKTIYYHLYTDSSFGTYSGAFYTLGAQTWTFLMTVPARSSYTVTLNPNGGSGGTKSLVKWYNESLSLTSGVTAPTRTGHKFAGWYENSSGTGSAATSYTGNAAKTYYAKWTPDTYTMTYKANGGSGSDQTQTKTYGVNATIKAANTFSRTGYTFDSWNTKADGTGTKYSAGGSYTGNAAVTLYAIWKINTWAVTYYGNNATGGSTSAQTKTYNQALTLRSNGFTRTNYNFVKWNTATNGSGTSYNAGATLPASVNNAVNLYAQWAIAHTSPSFTTFNVKRCTENGTENVEGQYMLVNAAWTCDSSATGSGTAKVVANGVTDTVSFTGTSGSISDRVHQNSSSTKTVFPIGSSFTVTLTVTDSDGYSSTKTTVLSVAYFTMHFKKGGTGVGIGKPSTEDNLLDVGMPIRLNADSSTNNAFIRVQSANRSADAIRFYGATDDSGDAIVVGDGGMTVIGAGESPTAWYDRILGTDDPYLKSYHPSSEHLFLTSDSNVWLVSNANTVANRKLARVETNGHFQLVESAADTSSATNGVSAATYRIVGTLDGASRYASFLQTAFRTDGMTDLTIAARNFGTGANVDNSLVLRVANDGTRTVAVSVPAEWRNALGASSGTWPVSVGGTGKTSGAFYGATRIYSSTATCTTFTLTSSVANYTWLTIQYRGNDGFYTTTTVFNNKAALNVALFVIESTANASVNIKRVTYTFSGTSATVKTYGEMDGPNSATASKNVTVTGVWGWA